MIWRCCWRTQRYDWMINLWKRQEHSKNNNIYIEIRINQYLYFYEFLSTSMHIRKGNNSLQLQFVFDYWLFIINQIKFKSVQFNTSTNHVLIMTKRKSNCSFLKQYLQRDEVCKIIECTYFYRTNIIPLQTSANNQNT